MSNFLAGSSCYRGWCHVASSASRWLSGVSSSAPSRLIHRFVKHRRKDNKPPSSALPERNFEMFLVDRSFVPLAAVPAQEGKPGNRVRESALVRCQRLSGCATDAITAQRSGPRTGRTSLPIRSNMAARLLTVSLNRSLSNEFFCPLTHNFVENV